MADIIDETLDDGNADQVTDQVTEQNKQVEQQDSVESRIPEKFRGKSIEDIVNSYTELEKAYGRKNQEIGELRQHADKFLGLAVDKLTKQPELQKEDPVDDEIDFFVDPKKAIERAIENHPKLKTLEQKDAELQRQRNFELTQKTHPDWNQIVNDEEFHQWVGKSKVRQSLMVKANNDWDFESADELFSTWKEIKGAKTAKTDETLTQVDGIKKQADEALKKASVSTGSSTEAPKKLYRRADLIRLRIQDPDRYDMMEDEIMAAYAEGRVK